MTKPTFQQSDAPFTQATSDLLVLFFHEEDFGADHDVFESLQQLTSCDTVALAKTEKFAAKTGQTFLFRGLANLPSPRLMFVGLGAAPNASNASMIEAGARAAREARKLNASTLTIKFPSSVNTFAQQIATGISLGAYQYKAYITPKEDDYQGIESVTFLSSDAGNFERTEKLTEGIAIARDLVNTPPQDLYPETMADRAVEIAEAHGLTHEIIDDAELESRGFNLIMAVGKGSARKPRLIHLAYTPEDGHYSHTIAFVGKGVTFDTGGNNIKTGGYMYHMHSDMAGGAAVLGAASAIGAIKPAGVRVLFIVAAAENSVSGDAMRPNDIYRGYGNQTVEIGNTDAEGRLCLADALAYAQELGAETIIDLATLTGACVVALGEYTSGLFTDSEELHEELQHASAQSGEDFWRLPLHKKLDKQLDSQVADMKNIGSRYGGAITAALFLKRWVEIDRWAHLDIAAPAYFESPQDDMAAGGTGFGVSTLVQLTETIANTP